LRDSNFLKVKLKFELFQKHLTLFKQNRCHSNANPCCLNNVQNVVNTFWLKNPHYRLNAMGSQRTRLIDILNQALLSPVTYMYSVTSLFEVNISKYATWSLTAVKGWASVTSKQSWTLQKSKWSKQRNCSTSTGKLSARVSMRPLSLRGNSNRWDWVWAMRVF